MRLIEAQPGMTANPTRQVPSAKWPTSSVEWTGRLLDGLWRRASYFLWGHQVDNHVFERVGSHDRCRCGAEYLRRDGRAVTRF